MKVKLLSFLSLCMSCFAFSQVGVGNQSPKVNMDARSAGNSAIAFGNTSQTATDAGAGAMKYANGIQYSDGTKWVQVATVQPATFIPKVVASGRSTVQQTAAANNVVNKWTFGQVYTNDGNWNTTTNSYTIPTGGDGFYQFAMAGGIKSTANANSSDWVVSVNTSGQDQDWTVASVGNFINLYTSYRGGSVTLYLTAGSSVSFISRHCFGCNTPPESYSIPPGATFTITNLGSTL